MMTSPDDQATAAIATATAPIGAALELTGLRRIYSGGVVAVDNVNLRVAVGEFVTLLGPSGSGKTTTLKMIAGFEYPESGSIVLGGRQITSVEAHDRDIGMVFQNYALFPHMTVFDNVAFPLRMRGKSKAEIATAVAEALAMVQLSSFGKRFPKQLSGGQQQRVALARSLVFRPPLLLMDEPLGALDRQLRKSVQQELKRITRALGITVIFVTHDQDEALYLSDRIAVMNHGRIVQCGAPEELYAEPKDRFVAEFMGESNFIEGTVQSVATDLATIRLNNGDTLCGVATAGLSVGSRAEVLIRPERLTIGIPTDQPSRQANRLRAQVEMCNFIGNAREYELLVDGQRVSAHIQMKSLGETYGAGQSVLLSVAERDCLIFPKAV